MRYSLLSALGCPVCTTELICIAREEAPVQLPAGIFPAATRVNSGPGVGPPPASLPSTPLAQALTRHAQRPAPAERALEFVVRSGLLVCPVCARWFPIEAGIPELLPDHLRNPGQDAARFESLATGLQSDVRQQLVSGGINGEAVADAGAHYKQAEIAIKTVVDDPDFFGPGYTAPFNLWDPEFTLYLLKLFGASTSLLDVRKGEIVIDSGCGYAWTTEWFLRSGVDAIGVDICRTYLEIGLQRMGSLEPHLVIGDVESLPLREGIADAVLAYESFHHLPNRPAAMRSYERVLKPGGRVVLAEPGGAHEHAQVAIDAMAKFGILEKGMELDDVLEYAAGTLLWPQQVYVTQAATTEFQQPFDAVFARTHSLVPGNLFKLVKSETPLDYVRGPSVSLKRRIWPKVKRRLKAGLVRLGLE